MVAQVLQLSRTNSMPEALLAVFSSKMSLVVNSKRKKMMAIVGRIWGLLVALQTLSS
jgi:hypothetical protein